MGHSVRTWSLLPHGGPVLHLPLLLSAQRIPVARHVTVGNTLHGTHFIRRCRGDSRPVASACGFSFPLLSITIVKRVKGTMTRFVNGRRRWNSVLVEAQLLLVFHAACSGGGCGGEAFRWRWSIAVDPPSTWWWIELQATRPAVVAQHVIGCWQRRLGTWRLG